MMVPFQRLPLSLTQAIPIFLLLAASLAAQDTDHHTTFIFNQFNGSNIILKQDAFIASNVVILTNRSDQMIGRVLYSTPLQVKGRESFSTTFVFCMVTCPPYAGGNGIAFFMSPFVSPVGAVGAQYFGLMNNTSNGKPYNHLFAVEFDTVANIEFKDINNNHVGVDLNNLQSSESKSAGYWVGEQFRPLDLNSGQNIQAWIDYDHLQNQLNVTITLAGLLKPIRPLISLKVNLSDIVQNQTYVGFSATTDAFIEGHYILAWSFSNKGMAPALDLSHLPSLIPRKSKYRSEEFKAGVVVASVLLLLMLFLAAALWLKRRKDTEFIEEWELEYWPHRFSYRELSIATKGFGEEQLLGSGGFGTVYKGVIPGSGLQVAVKTINREVTEGMKEFIAEISSMGRLQHRNLVQLRGWCRNNKRLFIVYDYMSNGSLDKLIFGNVKTVLRWPQRYTILKGVAAGLLYLHEQWEKRVIHRDIKSSNVLLDFELNARLGDFGLARLYDHTQNPQTTRVVGTLGYIAPELVHTGKATPSSDVFSFGVVMLEVACGRRPVDQSKDAEEVILVDWVRDLYAKENLMGAVDPKLCGEFDEEEVKRVLQLGLLCSHPDPERRVQVKQVLQILEGKAPLPRVEMPSFNTSIQRRDAAAISYQRIRDAVSNISSSNSHNAGSSTTGTSMSN